MTQYLLSAHAFLCMTEGHAVFLDLKRDAYSALEKQEASTLGTLVRGWPKLTEPTANAYVLPASSSTTIDMLLAEGLLTTDEMSGKEAAPIALQPATTSLPVTAGRPSLATRETINFLTAWALATWMLRTSTIERMVHRVRERKGREEWSDGKIDLEAVARLVSIYSMLQPWAFSPIHACLRNSFTLIEFLARYRMYPIWMFGVRMNPFVAHSWIQSGPVVINDTVEHVRTYTPIMAI